MSSQRYPTVRVAHVQITGPAEHNSMPGHSQLAEAQPIPGMTPDVGPDPSPEAATDCPPGHDRQWHARSKALHVSPFPHLYLLP